MNKNVINKNINAHKKLYLFCLFIGSIIVYTVFLQFFTGFHSMQHADSLMLSIMSYTKPTLYYWGQDKYFNFLPIMFSFIKNPICNLLLMSAFQLVMVILFPFFACKALLLDDTFTFGIITLSCLMIFPGAFWFEICYQPYAQSIFLVTVSIWFYSRCLLTVSAAQRGIMLLLSAFLALIAVKVADPSVSIFIIWSLSLSYDPNFIKKEDNAQPEDSRRAKYKVGLYVFLMSIFGSFYAVSAIIDKLYVKTYYIAKRNLLVDFNIVHSWTTFKHLIENFIERSTPHLIFPAMLMVITILAYALLLRKKKYLVVWKSLVLFLLPACIIILVMSSLGYVRQSGNFEPRYIYLSLFLFILNISYVVVETMKLIGFPHNFKKVISFIVLIGLAIILLFKFQISTFTSIEKRIKVTYNLEKTLALGNTLNGAIGSGLNYWRIWPTVWLFNASGNTDFFGISCCGRSINILDKIHKQLKDNKKLRLLTYDEDFDIGRMLIQFFPGASISKSDIDPNVIEIGYKSVSVAKEPFVDFMNGPLGDKDFAVGLSAKEVPTQWQKNELWQCALRVKNNGKVTLSSVGSDFNDPGKYAILLAYRWVEDGSSVPLSGFDNRTALPVAVKPNAAITMNMGIKAPSRPGKYWLEIEAVQELVAWFKDKGCPGIRIEVDVR